MITFQVKDEHSLVLAETVYYYHMREEEIELEIKDLRKKVNRCQLIIVSDKHGVPFRVVFF